ncbi:MAG TPA: DUF5060 domain-containing protein [Anaerohalosphaeraceae bacterium]|nr:DUF5060 domain-containing protein [Anaerohalosphaeraceae bacterium]
MKGWVFALAVLISLPEGRAEEPASVQRWGIFELSFKGPSQGNPFADVHLSAVFTQGERKVSAEGFYDGNGVYKIRFMPESEGRWSYEVQSSLPDLNGRQGAFVCTPAASGNHGPVRVREQYHFAYADGTPFFPFGTTIYKWFFQPDAVQQQTLQTLRNSPFNKVRFLLLPPGNLRSNTDPNALTCFPFQQKGMNGWDFTQFNPEYFRKIERGIAQLSELGVEADVILFHPYDRGEWGFDRMSMEDRRFYLRYVIARLAAFRNIWWSLANENSFIQNLTDEDWDALFCLVQEKDPYQHLRSMHNADRIYDYTKTWVTHVSLQYYMAARYLGIAPMLRDIYKKPIVLDEINYEGNIDRRWGQLSGEEMAFRFWSAYIGGAYATHGEALKISISDVPWTSAGGTLRGQSPPRISFLRKIVESGPPEGLEPIDQYYETNIAGRPGRYYLIYFGKEPIRKWTFRLPKKGLENGMRFRAERIDTWNMTIESVEDTFEVEKLDQYVYADVKRRTIQMPGRPYMALRLQCVD